MLTNMKKTNKTISEKEDAKEYWLKHFPKTSPKGLDEISDIIVDFTNHVRIKLVVDEIEKKENKTSVDKSLLAKLKPCLK